MIDLEGSIAGLRNIWARGAGMHKEPDDLWRYELLIEQVRPRVVLETGMYYGGSLLWFAERVPHVVTVEHDLAHVDNYRANRYGLGRPAPNGHIVIGDSLRMAPDVIAQATELAEGEPILVVLDSDHGTEHVYAEMCRYWLAVTVGSYMVVEDGILHYLPTGKWPDGNWFDGDPLEAIEKWFAVTAAPFEVDYELENARPTTQHPHGWLKRVA